MVNKEKYIQYMDLFLEENSKVNLISKNDERYLWEKHVLDSLGIEKFFEKYGSCKTLLDIGTGGGFPALPIAIAYPEIQVTAVDSIAKKIRAISTISAKLGLVNIIPTCARVETLNGEYDIVTSRAVSSLKNICEYALPTVKKSGYFVAYKSRKTSEEIAEAKSVLKKYKAEIVEILEYDLPLEENLTRNLIIVKRI
jgi:16S rRNA (guanine527-N7)-methyltransferase